MTIDELAQEIRRVDGNNSLGAGALAEALMPFLSRAPAPEGEVVKAGDIAQMTCFANNHGTLEDWAAWCRIRAALASPVVPVSREEDVRDRLEHARDLLMERVHGNPARSPGHNARLVIDAILAALGTKATDTGREG